jgi:hypothetical protein
MLNVTFYIAMLNVIMLNVVMPSDVAPEVGPFLLHL